MPMMRRYILAGKGHCALTKPLQAAADVVDVCHISLPEA